jgi:hypothetical protein
MSCCFLCTHCSKNTLPADTLPLDTLPTMLLDSAQARPCFEQEKTTKSAQGQKVKASEISLVPKLRLAFFFGDPKT